MNIGKKHYEAIKLMLTTDKSLTEIAGLVKVSRRTLYNWQQDEDFKEAYDQEERELRRRKRRSIDGLVDDAIARQKKILTKSRNDNAAAAVAKDVLDRAGYAPEEKVNIQAAVEEINNPFKELTTEQLVKLVGIG
ncbi:MAG: phBC6A51 family helix-turn-helix protein [Candidatus Ornithomonoglobus sp.]